LENFAMWDTRRRSSGVETARSLAQLLVWILAATIGIHYLLTAVLIIAGKVVSDTFRKPAG
jgi:hypothetical protein